MRDFLTNSSEETFNLGKQIAQKLLPGSVIALNGDLGSGKTCFTKGIAEGLGIKENITSPTYTIINEYLVNEQLAISNEQLLTFYHIDTYRLNNEKDFEDIGGKEIFDSNSICVVEWADKIKNLLPEKTISINIEITGANSRMITVKGIDIL